MVDSSGLENRHSSFSELSRVRIPLSPFARSIELFSYCISFAWSFKKIERMARLGEIAEPEKKEFNYKLHRNELKKKGWNPIDSYLKTLNLLSQLRGVIERTGSKSRSIPFSNPAAAARALPACHK